MAELPGLLGFLSAALAFALWPKEPFWKRFFLSLLFIAFGYAARGRW